MRALVGLLIACLWAPAVRAQTEPPAIDPEPAAAAPEPAAAWKFSARHTVFGYLTQQEAQADGPYNQGNRLARIPDRLVDLEWREDWRLDTGPCDAKLDLRGMARKTLRADAGIEREGERDAYVRTGGVGCRFGEGFEARLGREVLQWGNATFRAPSNPFFVDTGKTHPIRELIGKDLLQVGWRSASGLSVSAVHHFGNAQRDDTALGPFHSTTALRVDQVDPTQSLGVIASRRSDGRWRLGGYVTSTVSDAWLFYGDAAVQRGSDGLYPLEDAAAPGGWRFGPRPSGEHALRGSALLGAAYTFESGWSLTGEALVNNEGYDAHERDQARAAARAGNALWSSGTALAPAGAGLLGDALQPRLSVIGRHYVFLQLLRTEWNNRADVALRVAHNLDDGSSQFSSSLTWFIDDRTQLLWFAAVNRGASDGEFSRLLRYSTLLGLRFAF
jgi:hypothetical protein